MQEIPTNMNHFDVSLRKNNFSQFNLTIWKYF